MIEAAASVPAYALGVKITEKDIARFWAKVNKDGPLHPYNPTKGQCWPWTAGRQTAGYGGFMVRGKVLGTHRVSFFLNAGKIDPLLHVLHSCDNPPCCNPAHLSQGTDQMNTDDAKARGRHSSGEAHSAILKANGVAQGEKNPHSKLTVADVLDIRGLRGLLSLSEIGRRYGVSPVTVWMIIHRKNWAHVP